MKINEMPKFIIYIDKYFLIILLLNLFSFSKSIIQTGKYPYIKKLNNGYFIIVSSTSIIISDNTLTNIIAQKDFESPIYSGQDNIGSTTIAQFLSIDDGYILISAKNKLYIFSSNGECLAEQDISFISEKYTCSLIPHNHLGTEYYFSLIYGEIISEDKCQNLVFKKGTFNASNNQIIFEELKINLNNITTNNQEFQATISCDLMKKENKDYISCLFGNYNDLICVIFDPNNNYNIIQYQKSDIGGLYFKSIVLPEEKDKSIFCSFKSGYLFQCINYDINTNSLTNAKTIRESGCSDRPTSLIMEYFDETNEFIIGCYGSSTQLYLTRYNSNLEWNNITYDLINAFGEDYGNLGRVNIIFQNGQNTYNFVLYPNPDCNNNCQQYNTISLSISMEEFKLNNDSTMTDTDSSKAETESVETETEETTSLICITYYNYNRTNCVDTIPEGFYCNDTEERTIDKCHDNCKTCNKGYNIQNNNHNCLTCKNGKFYDLGNCVGECPKNFFNNGTIDKCKCSYNDACEECSIESNIYRLCITCNSNYYPKKNDTNNIGSFINCYNNETIGDGYYLNINQYEPCHNNCLKCTEGGNDIDNKCIVCKYGFSLIKNKYNIENCYPICTNYFFFDTNNNYQCQEKCPINYKIIKSTKKCIDNCFNDNNYKYEYNGYCYENCPNGTILSTDNINLCKEEIIYDSNTVIDNGIFNCSNIKKCLLCSEESINLNLCISCNIEEGYYPKSDENMTENGFIQCYKNPEKYYLSNNKYYPCYQTCLNCSENGDENNNNCIKCISNYEFKYDFENDNNCYEICQNNNYYYFDSNKKYHCTTNNACPENYKLISSKKKCVENCTKDNDYKYEYNNECIAQCQNNTHINDNEYKCIDNLNCENQDKYYSYDGTKCIDNVPIGFYCNNNKTKTIEKCHTNCKTCNKGPSEENNNCLTCKEETLFYDLGNCKANCLNGYFTDMGVKHCKCSTNITCKYCSIESKNNNLCESCNTEMGYYPLKDDINSNSKSINCYNNITIKDGYFLNITANYYEKCFSLCKKCENKGDDIDNKCISCKEGYSFIEELNNQNCYLNCNFYYYFDNSNNYFCTEKNECPSAYPLLIKDKKKCIDKCSKDNNYKFKYESNCYKECPKGTKDKIKNYICESEQSGNGDTKSIILINKMDNLINDFTGQNFSCDNNYIENKDSADYNIIIFKNDNKCSEEKTPKELSIIDFGECYQKIKEENNIDKDEELIVSKVELNDNKNSGKVSVYSFYHPKTGEKLNSSSCENKTILVKEDFSKKLELIEDTKEKYILNLMEQGINVLNASDMFYKDICYHYKSPNNRDVPLKARLSAFFPDIILCESGCDIVGVDFEAKRAKCECKFKDIVNIDKLGDNLYSKAIKEVFDVLSGFNVEVVKCIKDIFNLEKFSKCTGGFIILSLFLGQTICLIIFAKNGLFFIRKFFFKIAKLYLKNNGIKINKQNFKIAFKNTPTPPIKKNKKKSLKGNKVQQSVKLNPGGSGAGKASYLDISKKSQVFNNASSTSLIDSARKKKLTKRVRNKSKANIFIINNKIKNINNKRYTMIKINRKLLTNNNQSDIQDEDKDFDIKEYLSLSFDENDFDDAIEKDKRSFCTYFCEKYIEGQIFIKTFFIKEPLRPMEIKCLFLIIILESYLTITALFYNEDYLTELFYSNKEDSFLSFINRRYNELIYTFAINGIISYLLGFIFIEEKRIKKIFIKYKNSEIKMKYEISIILEDIKKRFIILVYLSIFLTIICYIYISCFNNVYPYIKIEWIKSFLFVLIVAQFINFGIALIQSILRYLSIRCKNEKLFKLSKIF